MTKKQKTQLITSLKEIAVQNGFTQDAWGNYKKQVGSSEFRIKFKKINCRFEIKRSGREWFNIESKSFVSMDPETFDKKLKIRTKGE